MTKNELWNRNVFWLFWRRKQMSSLRLEKTVETTD